MSAFVVSKDHINYLVAAAREFGTVLRPDFGRGPDSVANPDAFGQALWDENYRSVNHRYDTEDKTPEFHYDKRYDRFKFKTFEELAFLHKAVSCYDYQSCECPDYQNTVACRFCNETDNDILRRMLNDIDQTNKAHDVFPWGIDSMKQIEDVMRKMKIEVA